MNEHLEPKMPSFFVTDLRNSLLLHTISALNLNILMHNLFHPEWLRGSHKSGISIYPLFSVK